MQVAQGELHQCLVRVRGENRMVKNKLVATLERGQQFTRIAVEREKVCAIFVCQLLYLFLFIFANGFRHGAHVNCKPQ